LEVFFLGENLNNASYHDTKNGDHIKDLGLGINLKQSVKEEFHINHPSGLSSQVFYFGINMTLMQEMELLCSFWVFV
jgi:hypothetical protein